MEIARFGPRELRIVKGPTWSLPIHCEPYTADTRAVTHWIIRPAVQLLAAPFTELSTRFGHINLGTSSTYWLITNDQLDKLSERVSGCDAKDYLRWEQVNPGPEMSDKELIKVNDKDEEFLKFVCTRSSIDLPLGRYVWKAIKDGLQVWLVENQKPVDFELFTLYMLPFRANWKEIQLSKHIACYQVFKKSRPKWMKELIRIGFIEDLGSTDLLSMNQDRTFNWNLEVVPSKLWEKVIKESERSQLNNKKPARYAAYYESSIRRHMDKILTVFSTWVRQIRNPVAVLRESTVTGGAVLAPCTKCKAASPRRYRPSKTYLQLNNDRVGISQGELTRRDKISTTFKQMLDLSTLPPAIRDVRERFEPGNVDGGTGGLLLPDEGKGQAEGQRLLAEGERTES